MKPTRRQKEQRKQEATEKLQKSGFVYSIHNRGEHVVVRYGGFRWDLWPGKGMWVEGLNHKDQRHSGIDGLLERAKAVKTRGW